MLPIPIVYILFIKTNNDFCTKVLYNTYDQRINIKQKYNIDILKKKKILYSVNSF